MCNLLGRIRLKLWGCTGFGPQNCSLYIYIYIYIRSLHRYMEPSKFSIFGFADDHQLIKLFLPILQVNTLGGDISHCFDPITNWMPEFFLHLNSDKTKILVIMLPSLK